MSLVKLRQVAVRPSPRDATPKERTTIERKRSEAVKVYARKRADGFCEHCGKPAPFIDKQGKPYLEPHHIRRLADEGPDHPRWVAALCPNCHQKIHYGQDGNANNEDLAEKIKELEVG
jgi:5-methylcytosine-specific restriction protein A